ncbi:MAG: phospholipid carrier-dependent glycosyltransferase [Acidothermales bacterium]|nr:phospholipid carrier-dependent glycosyltransferase [Acidothermales bacterium]
MSADTAATGTVLPRVPPAPGERLDGASPSLRERLAPPMPDDGWRGWLWPIVIALIAGGLRLHRLGIPAAYVFDETYYAREAPELLEHGVEWDEENDTGGFIVHPPAGKWAVALGQLVFGDGAFAWRTAAVLAGTLSVLIVARVARRMTRSTLLGCVAGLLLALDGLHFVSSRTALLDVFLMFWVVAAFACLVADRDASRARLAATASGEPDARGPTAGSGPRLGLRPWRIAAGVCLGLACATKWSGLYYVAAFGILSVLWDVGARRTAGVLRPWRAVLRRDAVPGFVSLVGAALLAYLASWAGWFSSSDGWDRDWASLPENSGGLASVVVPDALRSLWHYHAEMFDFHEGLREKHPYQSHPWGWLALARPVSYFYEQPARGQLGCEVEKCAREVLGVGTPALWWAAVAALFVLAWRWWAFRDWRAGAVLLGVAAGWLPWFVYSERTIFSFYAVVFVPFLVLAVTLCLGLVLGPPGASAVRRRLGALVGGSYVLLVLANFVWLYPVLAARVIPYDDWLARMWFGSWI